MSQTPRERSVLCHSPPGTVLSCVTDPQGVYSPVSQIHRERTVLCHRSPGSVLSLSQTPQGVYCPGRVNTMPLPNVTDNFSFSSEIVDMGTSSMTYLSVRNANHHSLLGDSAKLVC